MTSSTTPVQAIQLDEILGQQLGSFTKLPKITAPFTTIVGRAQCVDPGNDHGPKFGINRVMFGTIQEVQGESGANGEQVWKAINDPFDQIRFVGTWSSVTNAAGSQLSSGSATDYVEIVFYGTGINLLVRNNTSAQASVDGAAYGANFMPASFSAVLDARNYGTNTVINAVSGLSPGTHTVKLSSSAFRIFGIEILNTSSTLQYVPGTSFVGGRKAVNAALVTDSYNSNFASGTLGTKGGHVVVYQNTNGTIQKAVQPTDATALYLSATNHVNESVIRSYNWREFGAGRADDFSYISQSSNITAAFTLDDNTTTLVGPTIGAGSIGGRDCLFENSGSTAFVFEFVGTGLDVYVLGANSGDTITIDGVNQGTILGLSNGGIVKLCSGLPYGTHTVLFTSPSGSSSIRYSRFIVYGPYKPAVPSTAVELADYYLMANYVASTTIASSPVSPFSAGVLFKSCSRELLFSGSGWAYSAASAGFISGGYAATATSGDSVQYTFFGTGIELHTTYGSTPWSATIKIDGVAYTGAATVAYSSTPVPTWTPGTSTFVAGGVSGASLQITGLSLQLHTITMTKATSTDSMTITGLSVVTPVHSPKAVGPYVQQAVHTIGSQALGDSRKFSTQSVKALNNYSQAIGVLTSATTSLATMAPMPDMTTKIKTFGNPLEIRFEASLTQSTSSAECDYQVYVDGLPVGFLRSNSVGTTAYLTYQDSIIVPVAAGDHIIQLFWGSGTAGQVLNARSNQRSLYAREL